MKRSACLTCIVLAGLAMVWPARAETPLGSAFTYQGRLTDGGEPANGPYDFHIHLYDAPNGGTPSNPLGITLNDVQVTEGVFTLSLDFGAGAFTGNARWLNIQVRPGASGGFYTALTPRQPLSAAPYALHALNTHWQASGAAVTNANAGEFVGINRTTPFSAAEYFGVQAPVQDGYGGMYIGTDGAGAQPFYGYRAGTSGMWTYFDGDTHDWVVHNGGPRFTITDTGDAGLGITDPAARLHAVTTTGNVAKFENTNASNTASALVSNTNGSGLAVWGKTTGSGSAGRFEISNSNSTSPALDVRTNGDGLAAKFTGGDVEVQGELHATIGTVMNRATPVAFGRFQPYGAGTLFASSGNVTITDEGSAGFRVFVVGEGDPESWIVVAQVNNWEADDSNDYIVKVGRPLAVAGQPGNGVVYMRARCIAGCEEFVAPYHINFVIYKGHD